MSLSEAERPVATGPYVEGTCSSPLESDVIAAIRTVFDPELPVSIYDLGLIYVIDIAEDGHTYIGMTLTAPGCPVAGEIPMWIQEAVIKVPEITKVEVEILWEPPWNPDNMSDAAKLDLGMF